MFFLIWGFRRRVISAGQGTYYCPVCKRVQLFALRQVARYFTLFFIPIGRTGAAVEYAVCLGCRNALKRTVVEAVQPAAGGHAAMPPQERPTLNYPLLTAQLAPPSPPAPSTVELPASPRPAAAAAFIAEHHAVAPQPAFGQSAFARATYARKRRPAPGFGAPASSGPSFFTPRR